MHTQRYYLIRSIVRYAFWTPIVAYVAGGLILGWANAWTTFL